MAQHMSEQRLLGMRARSYSAEVTNVQEQRKDEFVVFNDNSGAAIEGFEIKFLGDKVRLGQVFGSGSQYCEKKTTAGSFSSNVVRLRFARQCARRHTCSSMGVKFVVDNEAVDDGRLSKAGAAYCPVCEESTDEEQPSSDDTDQQHTSSDEEAANEATDEEDPNPARRYGRLQQEARLHAERARQAYFGSRWCSNRLTSRAAKVPATQPAEAPLPVLLGGAGKVRARCGLTRGPEAPAAAAAGERIEALGRVEHAPVAVMGKLPTLFGRRNAKALAAAKDAQLGHACPVIPVAVTGAHEARALAVQTQEAFLLRRRQRRDAEDQDNCLVPFCV